ncbi:MAG: response regulator [Alphaproteobacteria bacterium]|nr:response regulator [Alphaproteobacteria bacterium]MBF0250179.1 response regulator [Alphaproteobacteria bacterium]
MAMGHRNYDFSRLSVLLVEDSSYMRKILKHVLLGFGMRDIVEAEDGGSALNTLKSRPVDFVVTDWEMPVLNGIEFVEMVRRAPDSPNPFIPIIMVSGHSEEYRIISAREAGVDEYLVKPLSAAGLYSRMVAIIENRRPFVRTAKFIGPCRRRKKPKHYRGQERRGDGRMAGLGGFDSRAQSQSAVDDIMYKG